MARQGRFQQYASRTLRFLDHTITGKMDCHKLKPLIDIAFIAIEQVVSKLYKLAPLYISHYQDIITAEIQLAHISRDKKILDIGSGSIPASCILFAKRTNANITGIDKNPESVKRGSTVISQLGLKERITLIHTDALDFQMNDFDVILVANGITPYNRLLEYIEKSMRNDAVVIFRTFLHKGEELAERDNFLKKFFTIGQITNHEISGAMVSMILYKKQGETTKIITNH